MSRRSCWPICSRPGGCRDAAAPGPLARTDGLDRFSADEAAFTSALVAAGRPGPPGTGPGPDRPAAGGVRGVGGRADRPGPGVGVPAPLLVLDDDRRGGHRGPARRSAAEELTCGKLAERLRYRVLKADPDAARDRYQRVGGRPARLRPTGRGRHRRPGRHRTCPRTGPRPPIDRIDTLARAAKADGDPRTLTQLRADAYLDLLTGIAFATRPSQRPHHPHRRHHHHRRPGRRGGPAPDGRRRAGAAGDGVAAGVAGDGPVADADWLSAGRVHRRDRPPVHHHPQP